MEFIGYAGAVLMGLTLGMIGGGGSILSVPIFVYLFSISPTIATAYSLFVVGLVALIGGIQNYFQGQVDLKTGITFAIPSFIGVFSVRKFIMPVLPDTFVQVGPFELTRDMTIMIVFAVVMLAASWSMIRGRKQSQPIQLSALQRALLIAAEGLVVGGITGFVGAGGGFLIVPALVILVGLDMKLAVGTSLVIIAAKSLIGFLGDIGQTPIDWNFLFTFSGLAVMGLFVGTYASQFVPSQKLKKAFGWFVLVMGVIILGSQAA